MESPRLGGIAKAFNQCVIWNIGTYVTYVPGYIGFWSIFIRYIGFWVHRFFLVGEAGQFFSGIFRIGYIGFYRNIGFGGLRSPKTKGI